MILFYRFNLLLYKLYVSFPKLVSASKIIASIRMICKIRENIAFKTREFTLNYMVSGNERIIEKMREKRHALLCE